jgi:hypothetical protein
MLGQSVGHFKFNMMDNVLCLAAVPGPPTSIRLIGITEDSVTIEWTPPTSDGGRPVTRYVIEKREASSQYWTPAASTSATVLGSRAGTGLQCRVGGLRPNSAYYLRVAAENDEGIGYYREFIEPVRPTKPKSEYQETFFSCSYAMRIRYFCFISQLLENKNKNKDKYNV